MTVKSIQQIINNSPNNPYWKTYFVSWIYYADAEELKPVGFGHEVLQRAITSDCDIREIIKYIAEGHDLEFGQIRIESISTL